MRLLSPPRNRNPRPPFALRIELLEDRLQPGSVLPAQAWSDLDASLSALERDLRSLRPNDATPARHRLLDHATASPAGFAFRDATGARELLAVITAAPTVATAVAASDAELLAMAVGRETVPPAATGTPVTTVSVRDGTAQPSGLNMQFVPVTLEAADLATDSGWFNRATEFGVTSHQAAEGGGIQSLLDWSTYLTGTPLAAAGVAVTTDANGDVYVTGINIPDGETRAGFVAKYDPAGVQQYYTTFQAQDTLFEYRATEPYDIAVDGAGNAYVSGTALRQSADITDGFVVKLDPSGSEIVYGYTHGQLARSSLGTGIDVDAQGRAYVTGNTLPPGYLLPQIYMGRYAANPNPFIPMEYVGFYADTSGSYSASGGTSLTLGNNGTFVYMGGWIVPAQLEDPDFFGLKVAAAGGAFCGLPLCYAFTSPPNLGVDYFASIAVNAAGEAHFAGTLVVNGETPHGYATKVNVTGSDSPWAVIFEDTDHGYGIALGGDNVYTTGTTSDTATPDAYLLKLDPAGQPIDSLVFSGDGLDLGLSVAYRPPTGTAYLTGGTTTYGASTDGTTLNGFLDGFLMSVSAWV